MKYLKKGLYIFIPLLFTLFVAKTYISTNNFSNNLEKILKSSGLNVETGKIKIKGLNKIEIEDLVVKDQSGKEFIRAKKAEAFINLLVPSRISKVNVYDADVTIERYKNNQMNVYNILKKSDSKVIDRASRIGKINIIDSRLTYKDFSYDKPIEKKMAGVNGEMNVSKSEGFDLKAKAKDKGEEIGIDLSLKKPAKNFLESLFSNKKVETSKFSLAFDFKNVKLFEEASQFIPYKDVVVYDGILNGNLKIQPHAITGALDVKNGTMEYKDFDERLKNVNALISLTPEKIKIDANTKVDEKPVKLNVSLDMKKKIADIEIETNKISFKEINKYKQIKDLKIDADALVDGKIKVSVDIDKKLVSIKGKLKSDNIKYSGYNFKNVTTDLEVTKDKKISFKNTKFIFNENIGGKFKVNTEVLTDVTYDIDKKNGTGTYKLANLGSDYDISNISGTYKIKKGGEITSDFTSKELDGSVIIPPSKDKIIVSTRGKEYVTINYDNQKYELIPSLRTVVYNIKKQELESGSLDVKMKTINPKYYDGVTANIIIKAGNYIVNGAVNIGKETVNVFGNIDKNMNASLKTSQASIRLENIMKRYGYNVQGLDGASLPVRLNLNLSGKVTDLQGDFEVVSNYGNYIAEYEDLYVKGKIKSLQSLDIEASVKMRELWLEYQRFKDVYGDLEIKNNIVKLKELKNDKLVANIDYNLNSQIINIQSNLKNYVIYNTTKPEHNVYLDNMDMIVNGKLNSLHGNINITPSKTTIDSRYVGDFAGNIDVLDSVLNFNKITLRDNQITGEYDLKTGLADLSLHLDEKELATLYGIPDLVVNLAGNLNLKGDLNKFNLDGAVVVDNLSYKGYKFPLAMIDMSYNDGDVDKLLKKGTFTLKDFLLIGDAGEELFKTSTTVDLENLNVDYKAENKTFDLGSVKDLNEKGYNGNINYSFILKGNIDDFFSDLKLNAQDITLAGLKFNDIDIDTQVNNKGINIGQLYLDYENNPLIINGFLDFTPINYNIGILADNFNLKFLEVNRDVAQAGGIANVDILFQPQKTEGKIKLDAFTYKTKDKSTEIENVNADINVENRKLKVNDFYGGYNGGTFKITGNLDVPGVAPDFMTSKKIELGNFGLNVFLDKVRYNYSKGVDLVLSSDIMLTHESLMGNIIVESGVIREVPNFSFGTTEETAATNNKKVEKSIIDGIKDAFLDKIKEQYVVDLNISAKKDLKVDIPSISLVKNVKGEIEGGSRLYYDSGNTNLMGNYQLKKGSFELNNNKFNLESAEIRFTDPIASISESNPFIVISATTTVDGEFIDMTMNGPASDPNITFKSSSGLTKDQILSLLAFNTKQTDDKTDLNANNTTNQSLVGSVLDATINQLIFSPVTDKIERTLGLTSFSIKTNFATEMAQENYNLLENGSSTTLYIQDNLYKDKLFWNLDLTFPIQSSQATTTVPMNYNFWLNYKVNQSFGINLGLETLGISASSTNQVDKFNYYGGFDFSARFDSFEEMLRQIVPKPKLEILSQ